MNYHIFSEGIRIAMIKSNEGSFSIGEELLLPKVRCHDRFKIERIETCTDGKDELSLVTTQKYLHVSRI
ncbi:MAG: hypothetical protein Q8P07_00305 [bacterium]|nr:hypothetical protein [bacterium]